MFSGTTGAASGGLGWGEWLFTSLTLLVEVDSLALRHLPDLHLLGTRAVCVLGQDCATYSTSSSYGLKSTSCVSTIHVCFNYVLWHILNAYRNKLSYCLHKHSIYHPILVVLKCYNLGLTITATIAQLVEWVISWPEG